MNVANTNPVCLNNNGSDSDIILGNFIIRQVAVTKSVTITTSISAVLWMRRCHIIIKIKRFTETYNVKFVAMSEITDM